MPYAQGVTSDWLIEIRRHPLSGGYQVYLEDRNPRTGLTRGRVLGNSQGYARRESAERRADAEAQRRWAAEEEEHA